MQTTLEINGNQVPVKNLNKLFWPQDGFRKADIMRYYSEVWPYLNPHLRDRPVSLVRYPEGIAGAFFYQKDVPQPPSWLNTVLIASENRVVNYALINNLESLIWAINLGCIEIHPWLSRIDALGNPSAVIFDLDPMPPADLNSAIKIGFFIKLLLDELHLTAFPKFSGATGIHIYLPIKRIYSFQETSTFVKRCGEIIIKSYPDLATNERRVSARAGKVYIDHLQNLKGKTIASVYSLRPFPGAPVSIPVHWEELATLQPSQLNIRTALSRLAKTGDLFQPLLSLEQELPAELI